MAALAGKEMNPETAAQTRLRTALAEFLNRTTISHWFKYFTQLWF